MIGYYDTGVILKLYTLERQSDAVRRFVVAGGEALVFTELHMTECITALKLKCFRGECDEGECAAAIRDIESDLMSGVLRHKGLDWSETWRTCRQLSEMHAAATGCRTLDALHVACALLLVADEFITTDRRQADLASRAGLGVTNPVSGKRGKIGNSRKGGGC